MTKGIVFNKPNKRFKLKMATDDETFTTCSVCSATTDLKKDNWGWDYCACLDANYCPECSPTNACECGQDGSCECANCATDRPLANFSHQQIVHEMLARFIVPNYYDLEDLKERCLGEDAFDDLSKAQQDEVLAKVEHSMKENSRQCLDEYLDEMISMHIEEVKEGGC